jgi:hypothetical protein
MDPKQSTHPFGSLASMRSALIICFILSVAASSRATTAILPSDDQMVIASRAIVRAKVISQLCGFDARHDIVYTYVTLRLKEVLKGEFSSREIVLKEPGGQVSALGTTFFGTPRFTSGEDVVLYLDTWPDGSLRVHDMFLGKFTVGADQQTGQIVAVREVPGPQVEIVPLTALPPTSAQAPESTSRMEISAYLRMVRKRVAADAASSRQFEETYYQGVGILAQPPDYQDLARAGKLEPQFHLLANARWFEPDDGKPVTYLINPDGAPPGIADDVNAAMTAWSTAPGCSLRVVNGGTTPACVAAGVAVASFNNCTGDFPPGVSPDILAVSFINWNPTSTKVVNGTPFSQIVTATLAFNPYSGVGDHCRIQEIATHEMGHTLGLGHSWDPRFDAGTPTADEADATMFYSAHFDGRCASIRTDDISGISFIYPGQGGGGGLPPVISTITLPSGAIAVPYSATLAASGGTSPYTWTIASGSNPVPPGLALSAGGTISGTPTASGNFGFTVVVTDSASHTAGRNLSILIADAGGGGGGVGGFNAHFVSQSVPTTVQPGGQFQITITWNNIGTASWTGGNVNLGSQNPLNNTTWGTARLQFAPTFTINPGIQAQMPFLITAPSTAGVYQFQWQLTQDGGVGFFGDKSPSVAITVGNPAAAPPEIDTVATPPAKLGTPYSLALAASNGAPPYSWSMSGGNLPPGLSLGLLSGTITGTPTAAGDFNFTVKLTDSKSMVAQRSLVISVAAPPLTATAPPLPTAITGTPYNQPLSATGGLAPYAWSVTTGSLPAGLSLDAVGGTISGTPSAQGSFDFTVTVSDSQSTKATSGLSLHILVVGPEAVPHIDAVKYKSAPQKLIISGQNFDPAVVVLVDGARVMIRSNLPTQLLVKPLALASGTHTITVVNPNGVPPSTLGLTVN